MSDPALGLTMLSLIIVVIMLGFPTAFTLMGLGVMFGFAAYYDSCGRVDLMDSHKDEKPVFISGKDVRNTLLKGEQVDPRIMRPSTSKILAEAMAGKA